MHRYLKTGQETPATPPVPPVAKSSALPLNSRRTLPLRTSKTLRVTLCQPRPNHVQSLYVRPMSIAKGSDKISSNQKGIHQPADWTKVQKGHSNAYNVNGQFITRQGQIVPMNFLSSVNKLIKYIDYLRTTTVKKNT